MRIFICNFLFFVVFFCVSSFAKNVIFSGQFIDTVLVTEETKDPYLVLTPVESCKVTIFVGCIDETRDQYFATTDKNGNYSAELNLTEDCIGNLIITANAVVNFDTVANLYIIVDADTLPDTIKSNMRVTSKAKNDTANLHGYTFGIHTITPDLVYSGDSIMAYCTIRSTGENTDTLHFYSDYRIKSQLVTSSGDTVFCENFFCDTSRVLYLENGLFKMHNICPHIPKDLQNSHPDFAKDRKLTLVIRFNDDSNIFDTVSFHVIDNGIAVQPATSTRNHNHNSIRYQSSAIKLSSKSSVMQVYLSESGMYTIDLFSIDGRMLQRVTRNKRLNAGEHIFDIGQMRAGASKAIIARINNGRSTLTSLVNLL